MSDELKTAVAAFLPHMAAMHATLSAGKTPDARDWNAFFTGLATLLKELAPLLAMFFVNQPPKS